MKSKDNNIIIGLDLSLNHFGLCLIGNDFNVIDYRYMTKVKKEYNKNVANSFLLRGKTKEWRSKACYSMYRMQTVFDDIMRFIYGKKAMYGNINHDIYIALEGYAYGARSSTVTQLAELVGALKQCFYISGMHLRIYDPLSVKFIAAGKGNALKKDVVEAAKKNGFNISNSLIKNKTKEVRGKKVDEYNGPATDLADSYWLAVILLTEIQIRNGTLELADVDDNTRKVFNRVTKAMPENILSRPFITSA